MKAMSFVIGFLFALVACTEKTQVPEPAVAEHGRSVEGPSPELSAIDSLMWHQPDSALAVMMEFAANVEADSMDTFEGHYCQLLISELLYKNYYEQSNREDLLKAVGYFDSLTSGMDGVDTRGVFLRRGAGTAVKERNVFLDARAHYINGAGFYEKGDAVRACEEYLNALEMMEEHFDDKAIIGKRAVFMAYTYNRLMELFSEQFMSVPAITCGENALEFCKTEPSLSNVIPIIVFHIGMQYDKKGEKDEARQYYVSAMNKMSDTNSLIYRDMVSLKALCDYQLGTGIEQTMNVLKETVSQAYNEQERLTRFITIGDVFYEEGLYDSALVYLEPVFINSENKFSKVQSAEYLRVIYDGLGNKEKLDECVRYLASHKKTVGETNTIVSELEDKFKEHMGRKQKKEAEAEREKSIGKTIGIIIPIAVAVALALLIVSKLRGWKKLKQQQAEADRKFGEKEQEHEKELRLWQVEAEKTLEETVKKHEEALKSKETEHEQEMKAKQAETLQQMEAVRRSHEEEMKRLQAETEERLKEAEQKHQQKMEDMMQRHEAELRIQKDQSEKEIEQTRQRHKAELEAERLAYQKEREELQLSLQLSKRSVNTLQEELGRKRTDAKGHYEAFLREPVCVIINDKIRDLHITTRKPYVDYDVVFNEETLAQFCLVVSAYYGEVKPALLCLYPGIAQEDLLLCYLYLLGMKSKQIAVVRHREYSTVRKQAGELKKRLGIEESVRDYVLHVAGVEEFVEE